MQELERPAYIKMLAPLKELIKTMDFGIADELGYPEDESHLTPIRDQIGLLKGKDPLYKKYIWRLIKFRQHRPLVATLWLGNKVRGADSNRYVLEAHGEEYFGLVRLLGEKIEKEFGVNILLRHDFYNETDRIERLRGDGGI